MSAANTRVQIVEAADRLFYERGFEATTFGDIASATGLSRGNFYYHFRTKDEILDAVIELRLANTSAMLAAWEHTSPRPADRIRSFIEILIVNRTKIIGHGCPVGTLCTELSKLNHPAATASTGLFRLFRDWLKLQFVALGRADAADALALHALMRSQGVATLATAFKDETFIRREVADLKAWLDAQAPNLPEPLSLEERQCS
jgi:TetR/AcrR family transcriptional regulator, transcriptional repressor for nem operon